MPRIDYNLTALLGTMYRRGPLVFSSDGLSIYSPVGHRVTRFSLSHGSGATGTKTLRFECYQPIVCMALGGRLLLAVDGVGGAVLCDVEADTVIARMTFKGPASALSFSPDCRFVALAINGLIEVWRVPSAAKREFVAFAHVITMSGHGAERINSVEWSPDGRFILTSGNDMAARVFNFASDTLVEGEQRGEKRGKKASKLSPQVLQAHKHPVLGAFFTSPERILTVGRDGAAFEWTWDGEKGRVVGEEARQHLLTLSRDELNGMNDNNDNNGNNGNSGNSEDTFRPWIAAVAFQRDFRLLIVGFQNGSFGLFKQGLFEGDPLELVHALSLSCRAIDAVAVGPGGHWLAFGSANTGQLLVWEWETETYVVKQHSQSDPRSIIYSPDGSLVAAGGIADGVVRVWSTNNCQGLASFGADGKSGHLGPVTALAFSSKQQGRVLVSTGEDGTVRAWDAVRLRADAGPFRIMTVPNEGVKLTAVAIDPAGEIVVAGGAGGEIFVFSLRDGQLIDRLHGHEGAIRSISFDPTGNGRLLTASWDRTVRLWSLFDRDKKMTILEHESDVLAAVWRPDGREIASACLAGTVVIWGTADVSELSSDYVVLRTVDVKRDIKNKPLSGAHVRSLSYSSDGQFLIMAGCFPWVGLYDAECKTLLQRFPLTTVRKTKKEHNESAEAFAVAWSPHGRSFSVISGEGILIFSRDAATVFDPVDLDVDVTLERVMHFVEQCEWPRALALAARLNSGGLILRILHSVPSDLISIVAHTVSSKFLAAVLRGVVGVLEGDRVEFGLHWAGELLSHNAVRLSLGCDADVAAVLRVLERRLNDLMLIDRAVSQVKADCAVLQVQARLVAHSIQPNPIETVESVEH